MDLEPQSYPNPTDCGNLGGVGSCLHPTIVDRVRDIWVRVMGVGVRKAKTLQNLDPLSGNASHYLKFKDHGQSTPQVLGLRLLAHRN